VNLWLTRAQAAEYLCCSVDTIDRMLTPIGDPQTEGRIRYRRLEQCRGMVRLWTADVVALCPPPDGEEIPILEES